MIYVERYSDGMGFLFFFFGFVRFSIARILDRWKFLMENRLSFWDKRSGRQSDIFLVVEECFAQFGHNSYLIESTVF